MHAGADDQYVALYSPPKGLKAGQDPTYHRSGLNHIGVVVADLEACERGVIAEGYQPGQRYDYEPGRRFYFTEENGVEIEVISYAPAQISPSLCGRASLNTSHLAGSVRMWRNW